MMPRLPEERTSLFVPVELTHYAPALRRQDARSIASPIASRTADSVPPKKTRTTTATTADSDRLSPYSTTP